MRMEYEEWYYDRGYTVDVWVLRGKNGEVIACTMEIRFHK